MITKKQKLTVLYFISRALFLGVGFSLLFDKSGKDAWISIILGTIMGLFIVVPISKVLKYKKDKTLYEILKDMKLLGFIIKIIFMLFLIFLLYECIVIIQTLIISFFLINTHPIVVGVSGAVLAILTIKEDDSTLFKVAETLIVISIFTLLITFSILLSYSEFDAFLPVLTTPIKNIFIGALYYTAFSTGPLLLTLDFKDDGKHFISCYLSSSLALLFICIVIIGVLGPELIKIYRFPEYMVLKRIKLLDFIEKVENIISIIWILDAFMILATTTKTLKNLFPKKCGKICSSLILIIVTITTGLYFGSNYVLDLEIYYYVPIILGSALFLILIPIFIFSLFKYKKRIKS